MRDLWSVMPDTERFNRGGMSVNELLSRLHQSGAEMALVVSLWKGNPHTILFLAPTGKEILELRIESGTLRREISQTRGPRVHSAYAVTVETNPSENIKAIASILSSALGLELKETSAPIGVGSDGSGVVEIRFTALASGKILWTFHHAYDGREIGPRIRVSKVRRMPT